MVALEKCFLQAILNKPDFIDELKGATFVAKINDSVDLIISEMRVVENLLQNGRLEEALYKQVNIAERTYLLWQEESSSVRLLKAITKRKTSTKAISL